MKAFLISLVALVLITVAANRILVSSNFSARAMTYSSENVRLDDRIGWRKKLGKGNRAE
ncbi:hypothetical protein [Roseovarius dicentrarchi]|uniref:hypothetical protein n=1 Tax=Roseovarius dicentrarchi TaxID=2250573 RepID=UPI0013966EF9|nr:hypothetical protein [Roseovarius dicentrarchi]